MKALPRLSISIVGLLLAVTATIFAVPATAAPASLPALEVSRLDADAAPRLVLSGAFDADFTPVSDPVVRETGTGPRWWRVVSKNTIAANGAPQLTLDSPQLNRVEFWLPGQTQPLSRSVSGPDEDLGFSTQALVVGLPDGLKAGAPIYLRVHPQGVVPMRVSIRPLAEVHRSDLQHVAWRTMALVGLTLLALLALGFWVGIGERSYAFLIVTLLAQAAFLATSGGEIRQFPWLADLIGNDIRLVRFFALLSMAAWLAFLAQYLALKIHQPRLMRVITMALLVLVALMVLSLATTSHIVPTLANLMLFVMTGLILVVGVAGAWKRQRAAYFVLLSWLPLMFVVVLSMTQLLGGWDMAWVAYALPISLTLSGVVVTVGLTDTLQQLRRDRDDASRQAKFDLLTGALSRPEIEQRLAQAVALAHRSRRPLSVIFFDVDRFKGINDQHGHRVGDHFLQIIASRTRNRLRTYDLMGRWGGDELIVVLPDTRLGEALGVAENLRSAINYRPLTIDGSDFPASLSLGVAELATGETAAHLLERADAALYASKAGGRDRVTGHDPRVSGSRPLFAGASDKGAGA